MSVGTYELGGISPVTQERIDGIVLGDVPSSVAEIEAVERYANEFSAHSPGIQMVNEPVAFVRQRGDGLRILTPQQHSQIAELGTRDAWRLTPQDRVDFDIIAFHTSLEEIPTDFLGLFLSVNGDARAVESLRQQALDRLSLASQIDEVEAAEAQARHDQRVADAHALLDGRRALRIPIAAELREQALMQQDTQVLPVVSAMQRDGEVISHRHNHRHREGFGRRFARFLGDRLNNWLGYSSPNF